MQRIMLFVSVMALGGCMATARPPQPAPFVPTALATQIDDEYVKQALEYTRNELIDPDSAKFTGLYAAKTDNPNEKTVICGYVNAKNRLGGYTGKKRFMAMPSYSAVWEESPQYRYSSSNEIIRKRCNLKEGEKRILIKIE